MNSFDKISARTSSVVKKRVSRNLEIAERINEILEDQKLKQKDLAKMMGKQPSEVSKWLTGLHNFELKTIEAIETALGFDIINVAKREIHIVKAASSFVLQGNGWGKSKHIQGFSSHKSAPHKRAGGSHFRIPHSWTKE
jgi:transcriptional regulator with XRE-family HTH domain